MLSRNILLLSMCKFIINDVNKKLSVKLFLLSLFPFSLYKGFAASWNIVHSIKCYACSTVETGVGISKECTDAQLKAENPGAASGDCSAADPDPDTCAAVWMNNGS